MSWYNSINKVQIPRDVASLKQLIERRFALGKQREEIIQRLQDGAVFISQAKNSASIKEATKLFSELAESLNSLEDEITTIDIRTAGIIEMKVTDFGFGISLSRGMNDIGERQEARKVFVVPWEGMAPDGTIEITPDEMWAFSAAKKIFGSNPNNIEFIRKGMIEDAGEEEDGGQHQEAL